MHVLSSFFSMYTYSVMSVVNAINEYNYDDESTEGKYRRTKETITRVNNV